MMNRFLFLLLFSSIFHEILVEYYVKFGYFFSNSAFIPVEKNPNDEKSSLVPLATARWLSTDASPMISSIFHDFWSSISSILVIFAFNLMDFFSNSAFISVEKSPNDEKSSLVPLATARWLFKDASPMISSISNEILEEMFHFYIGALLDGQWGL